MGKQFKSFLAESSIKSLLMGGNRRRYYPKYYNPIHEVTDWNKVRSLVRAAIRGKEINPILADGENLLAGTHRAAANDALQELGYSRLIDEVQLDDLDDDDGVKQSILDALEYDDFEEIDRIWDRD